MFQREYGYYEDNRCDSSIQNVPKGDGVMGKTITRRSFFGLVGTTFGTVLLSACSGNKDAATNETTTNDTAQEASTHGVIDYMVLVNKQHKLPADWEAKVDLVEEKSLLYDDPVKVERKAYEAYQSLKEGLAAEGVYVELDSCYRSVKHQQEVMDEFVKEKGEEYAKRIVATPGYSEHHTGLALDLFLVIDGKNVAENDDMMQHPEVWQKVHAKLADHGFILRYLPERKIFTGYSYEPWHIRYIDNPAVAKKIADAGLTFEEYLNQVPKNVAGCEVDYGASEKYAESDIDSTIDVILGEFGKWNGCVMKRFAFAGDDACGEDELEYVNSLRDEGADEFGEAIVLVTDFHTPDAKQAEGTAWEPDTDYEGYTWHLGRKDAQDAWHLMTWGYA